MPNEFERLSSNTVLIDGRHYRLMSDDECAEFIWSPGDEEMHDADGFCKLPVSMLVTSDAGATRCSNSPDVV